MFGLFKKKDTEEYIIPGGEVLYYPFMSDELGSEMIYIDFTRSQHRQYSQDARDSLKNKILEGFHKVVPVDANDRPNGGKFKSGQIHIVIRDVGAFVPENPRLDELYIKVKESLIENGAVIK